MVKSSKQWYIYFLECSDATIYTGVTTDVERRLKEHNAGSAAKYTRNKTPVKLLWSMSVAGGRSGAQKLEARFKKLSRTKKMQQIAYFVEQDISHAYSKNE